MFCITPQLPGSDGAPPAPAHDLEIGSPGRDGLVAAYQASDILLFPSRLEGFGIAPAGVGLRAAGGHHQCSALPEVVDDGQNGFLPARRRGGAAAGGAPAGRGCRAAPALAAGEHGREKVVSTFGYHQLGAGFVALYQPRLLAGPIG